MSPVKSMTRDKLRAAVLDALAAIAPEVDPASVQPGDRLRDRFELDSMDYLNFLIALGRDLEVDIPEADYPKIATLDGCLDYLLA